MSNSLIDISGKIDQELMDFYAALAGAANACRVEFFIIGATARDMVLTHGYGIAPRRMTEDIDIGVQISDWDTFNNLKAALIETGDFADTGAPQRLRYRGNVPVDLVPFGPIETVDSVIEWPPDQADRMNVVGFRDVLSHVSTIRLSDNPVLEVSVASLAGLALLKIAAWPDRGHVNRKDATDLAFLMQVYLDAGNNERLYEEHADLLGDDFDYELAGARLLGRDIATITSPETRTQLLEILQVETGKQAQYRMIEAMQRAEPTVDFDRQLKLVESLYAGLKSATEQSR